MKTCFSEEKLIKQFENPPFSENPRPTKMSVNSRLKAIYYRSKENILKAENSSVSLSKEINC